MVNRAEISATTHAQIDQIQAATLREGYLIECPLKHVFSPGLYTRTIFMQAGALVTSMIHAEEHQYFVLQGTALVKVGVDSWEKVTAPYGDVTKAGTRRVLYIEEECIWTTVHATSVYPVDKSMQAMEEAVRLVEDQIFVKRENHLVGGFIKGNQVLKIIDK